MNSTPHLPPEWNPQRAILISWPHCHHSQWDQIRCAIETAYITLVKAIALNQSVMLICYDLEHRQQIQQLLIEHHINLPRVCFFIIPSSSIWTRDYGPITLRNGQNTTILNFQYNGWGTQNTVELDRQIPATLFQQNCFPKAQFRSVNFALDGGNIEVDGAGTLLTINRHTLSQHRDPHHSQQDAENLLKDTLHVQRVLWLNQNELVGDQTGSHIDTLARFINPQTLCYSQCADSSDEQYHRLAAVEHELRSLSNYLNQPYRLVPLPLPRPIYSLTSGKRLPATYTSFVITNQTILIPQYDDPQDDVAKNVLQSCFPNRDVIGIPCRPLIEHNRSLHGITMQIPV